MSCETVRPLKRSYKSLRKAMEAKRQDMIDDGSWINPRRKKKTKRSKKKMG